MSIGAAIGWTAGVMFVFLWLLTLIVSRKPAAQFDLVSTFSCQAAAYLAGLFGILQVYAPKASIREFLGVRRTHVAFFPLAIALGASMVAPTGAIYRVIAQRWPTPDTGEAELLRTLSMAGPVQRVAFGFILIAFGPMVEEVLFRGALARPLRRAYSASVVIAVTSALFAVTHMEPQKFLPIGLFGVVLGVLRVASGSLLPPILLHASYNAIQFFALLTDATKAALAPDGSAPLGPPPPVWVLVLSSTIALGLIALARVIGSRAEDAALAREKDGG